MKTRKFTALLIALCMLLSLSISAFAADDAVASGTIPDSKIVWELDSKGWLTISGSGDCSAFASKDDQPWAEYREQITQVWFDSMEDLAISDLAYWFEDCTNLTTAEIPSTTPTIGRHAFYNCPLLTKLSIYYGEHTLDSIGEDAFWRGTDSGDTLYIGYLIGYPKSSVPFHTYNWSSSNRNERYFYDLYGSNTADVSLTSTGSIIGNCPSCGKYSFQGVYVEIAHSSQGHANYNECYDCHYAIMRIASDRRYKSPDGEKLTDFISIKVRGVLAERCAEFARKGCKIAASGDFETITFAEEPERQPGFLLKATEVEFLSPRKELDDAAELPAAA